MSKVLGIDPGTHRVGWGVIEGTPAKQKVVACGCIESPARTPVPVYLVKIETAIQDLISLHHPDYLGLETLLFQKNVKTAISVAQARGVILLTAANNNIPVIELAPNSIKLAVAGSGSAGKLEVERMVGLLLGIDTRQLLDDTTDALASAIATLVVTK